MNLRGIKLTKFENNYSFLHTLAIDVRNHCDSERFPALAMFNGNMNTDTNSVSCGKEPAIFHLDMAVSKGRKRNMCNV